MVKRNFIKNIQNKIKAKRRGRSETEEKKQTKSGENTIINTRKSCSIIPLYIPDTPLHSFLSKKT